VSCQTSIISKLPQKVPLFLTIWFPTNSGVLSVHLTNWVDEVTRVVSQYAQ